VFTVEKCFTASSGWWGKGGLLVKLVSMSDANTSFHINTFFFTLLPTFEAAGVLLRRKCEVLLTEA